MLHFVFYASQKEDYKTLCYGYCTIQSDLLHTVLHHWPWPSSLDPSGGVLPTGVQVGELFP
jgi:hypothetical protein